MPVCEQQLFKLSDKYNTFILGTRNWREPRDPGEQQDFDESGEHGSSGTRPLVDGAGSRYEYKRSRSSGSACWDEENSQGRLSTDYRLSGGEI